MMDAVCSVDITSDEYRLVVIKMWNMGCSCNEIADAVGEEYGHFTDQNAIRGRIHSWRLKQLMGLRPYSSYPIIRKATNEQG